MYVPPDNEELLHSDTTPVGDYDVNDEDMNQDTRDEGSDTGTQAGTQPPSAVTTPVVRKSGRKNAGQNGVTEQLATLEAKFTGPPRKRSMEPDGVDRERLEAIVSYNC